MDETKKKASPNRKRRGRETEIMVAAAFSTDGWPYAVAVGAGTPGRDVTGVPGLAVEVKARANFDPMAHLRQANRHAKDDEIPVVVMRPNGYGVTTVDEWPVFLTFDQFRRLLKEAGYACDPGSDLNGPHAHSGPRAGAA